MKVYLILTMTLCLCFGCSQENPTIEGYNEYVWKRDTYGCKGERGQMVEAVLGARDVILGMREAQVLRLLGKADEQEMYSRNQKFLIYYLEPNEKCTMPENVKATAKALRVRINAIGVANEIYVSAR